MSQQTPLPFNALTGTDVRVRIVDVGASPEGNEPQYLQMLRSGNADILGFEPDPEALAALESRKGPYETYLPHAVGDGRRHTLHLCAMPEMSSLLRPNPPFLNLFHGFPQWGEVVGTREVDTVRLDDIPAAAGADMLKLDIQGAELMALRNAVGCLRDAVIVQAEVEFLPLYVDQPLFSDVELFLREQGFVFHRFFPQVSRTFQPVIVNNNVYSGLGQLVWADAVFVKDFTRLDRLSDRQLLALSSILHDCYRSLDLVYLLLRELDRRQGRTAADAYLAAVQSAPLPQFNTRQ
ncbi:MAG TPA: FkbM family methyltransferase [Azospirillaceae bacterium]|nr:FkbM family methyltransferase [Azospirillaceae bacterium]